MLITMWHLWEFQFTKKRGANYNHRVPKKVYIIDLGVKAIIDNKQNYLYTLGERYCVEGIIYNIF